MHDDFVKTRFVHKPAGTGIGKTEIAVKVTPVGQVNICKERPRMVVAAQATRSRTGIRRHRILGIGHATTDRIILCEPVVHRRVRPVNVPEHPMLGAGPHKPDLPLFFYISASRTDPQTGQRLRVFLINIISTRCINDTILFGF